MTFNQWCAGQWCAGKTFAPSSRLALEQIWTALIGAGYLPPQISAMFTDLLDNFKEKRR